MFVATVINEGRVKDSVTSGREVINGFVGRLARSRNQFMLTVSWLWTWGCVYNHEASIYCCIIEVRITIIKYSYNELQIILFSMFSKPFGNHGSVESWGFLPLFAATLNSLNDWLLLSIKHAIPAPSLRCAGWQNGMVY